MKALLFVFSLAIVGGHSQQWKKIGDLKESIVGYNQSAENIFELCLKTMHGNKLKAAQFIDRLATDYMLKFPELNTTSCYRTRFNLTRFHRTIQSEISRSQVPLENLLIELRGKLDGINNAITLAKDLTDVKYSICKFTKENEICEEETNLWLEEYLNSVRCQIIQTCHSHVLSKRSADYYCPVGQFVCNSGECISIKSVCDGKPDCSDGTDENMCCFNGYKPYHGSSIMLRCTGNKECIELNKLCDGKDDCKDGSDELRCGRLTSNCSMEYGMHSCEDGKCIGLGRVCDGNRDCRDASDEGPSCGVGLCPEECTRKGGVCYHGPRGPQCFDQCPLGTFQTPQGCAANAQPTNRTVLELMEEIPKSITGLNDQLIKLKMKAIETISKIMSDVFFCLDPNYSALAKVVRFPITSTKPLDEGPLSNSDDSVTKSDNCLLI